MAILKDLIVHGSSRFLNKIYADELETSAFEAESAIIKKLTAKDATMENATVIGLLDVQGQLHTNTWTNSNIATIDGCFYITPTLSSDSGKISFSSTSVASLTGSYSAVTSLYIGDSSSGSTVQWTKDSKILLTGEVEVNGQWLPLGTLLGTLSANASTSSIGLTGLTDNRHNPSSIITDIRNAVSNASLNYRNLKISLYQRKDGTDSKPLGIYMTAMGTNGKTFIDIYGGVNATTTAGSSGGFADPNLRIGNLSGLGAVEGTTPTGWGIYTTNGYFKGVIVSSAGKIGGFDIGASSIKNTKTSYSETTNNGVWVGTDGIGLGKGLFYVTNAGALTAKSGSIAGWSFNTTSLYKTNATPGYNTSTMVISTGTASTNNIGGGGTASKTWMISAGTGFGVTTAGVLYCNNAHISGEITATSGTIGGASITNGVLLVKDANISGKISASHIDVSSITIGSLSGADNYALKDDVPTTVAELTDSGSYLTTSVASNTYATQTNLNNEINARKAVYGTSSTDAGTATKAVTCSNFALYTGASVTVTFSKTNTSSAPQLNVNSTGAKPIKSYTGANLTEGEYKWAAGATITFTYDGTNWRIQDGGALQAKIDAASSASTASSQAGVATQQATNATNAKTAAESAKTAAESAKTAAQSAKTAAETAKGAAETASSQASSAKDTAVSAKNDAVSAKTDAETAKGQAQTAAGNASQSATNAANSATAAAEVMGGFTILWNYSAFTSSDNGEGYLCAFDPATGTKSDANGWVKWNGVKRTITKQMINPNTVLPYNIPIYVVCRLSSATATTGTNYMVWYNSGWKYAVMPTPTAVGGSWTWADNTDIVLGKFVETASEAALTEYEIYNPPYTSKQITTNVVTAQSASASAASAAASAASAAQTATTYITYVNATDGIKVHNASDTNNYLQLNSSAISMYKGGTKIFNTDSNGYVTVGKVAASRRNVYITDSAVQIRNNTSVLAEYGDSIKLYNPTKTTTAVEISSTGASFNGNVKATSLSTGNKTASTTGKGTYIDGNGNIYVGDGSSNNFTVTDTGTITATGANLLTATIGNATNKITIGTGTSGHSSIRYGMTTLADTTNNGFYIGTDGIALGKGAFKVTAAGVLNATGATISGDITATSGTIGGASISDGILQITNANISGTISANHIDASSLSIGISQVSNLQNTLDGKASTSAVTTAAGTASKYISVIDQNGIKVHAENNKDLNYTKISSQAIIMYQSGIDIMNLKTNQFRIGTNTGNNIKIDINGITINNGSTQVASYKDSIILGDEANNNLLFLDKSSLSLRSGMEDFLSGNEVFEVGECAETISKTVTSGQASYQWSELTNNTKELKEVTLNGALLEEGVDYTFNLTTGTITLTNAPTNSTAKLKVSFIPINPEAIQKTITFTTPEEEYWLLRSFYSIPQHVVNIFSVSLNGTVLTSSQYSYNSSTHILKIPATPTESNAPAAGSIVEVVYTKSLGYYYTLGKRDLTKIGDYSIATGYNCMAAGDKSFAGGNYTYVAGQSSFGYGSGTSDADCVQVIGNCCGGIGRGITVYGEGNFGCGNYNVPSSSYIFSVGNGSSSTDRKNAFWVAKSGNARVAGALSVMNGLQVSGEMRSYIANNSGTVPMFWYDTKRINNISVPANSTNTGLNCDITMTNHTPMGIVGMRILNSSSNGANAASCNLYIYMIVNNTSEDHVTFSIRNFASSAAKVDVEFKIFYIANKALSSQISWT